MRQRLSGQRRGEAGTSDGDLYLHVDLPSLDRQGRPLCRSVLQALLDLPADQLRRLGDRRQAVRAANLEVQEARNGRTDDRIAAVRLGREDALMDGSFPILLLPGRKRR